MLVTNHINYLRLTSLLCIALLIPGETLLIAQQPTPPANAQEAAPPPVAPGELDSLVAPIALYPDPLLAQVLAASTYPLEIVQLQQWLTKHQNLKDKALADALEKENWDPSVQAMAALPDLVKQLGDNIKWTSELGNAFLAQQSDVMDAVQRMRAKAQDGGKLKSTEQMKVETKVVENKTVVVIEQANPKVVYVPSYDPVVVWGAAPVYAYPPVYYPPPGYYAAGMALSFGVGVAMGAMFHGGWGYGCGWGGNNNININNNNTFVNNSNRVNGGNRNQVNGGNRGGGNNSWQHNPSHRGGAPYGDRATANKFGGNARGDSAGSRQSNARQNQGAGNRQQAGVSNRASGGAGNAGANRGAGAGNAGGNRGASAGNTAANRGGGGGGDRVGRFRAAAVPEIAEARSAARTAAAVERVPVARADHPAWEGRAAAVVVVRAVVVGEGNERY
jgi:hypothetical protein